MSPPHNHKFTLPVKMALLKRKWTVKNLAERIGNARPTVSTAIYNPGRYPRVHARILEELKLS